MIVILGAGGTLGREFVRVLGDKCVALTRQDFDFLDQRKLEAQLRDIDPEIIINCAAVVSLAAVAENPDYSFRVNALLPQKLALYCAASATRTKLLHISTDHFFESDNLFTKHSETHPITILNDYAAQKYVAEQLVLAALPSAFVVRSSLLGIRNLDGKTLLEWIIKTLKYSTEIVGYSDAVTSALPVEALVKLALAGLDHDLQGLYNIGAENPYTKLNLIKEIVDLLNLDSVTVAANTQSNTQIVRARSCGLDSSRFAEAVGDTLPKFPEFLSQIALGDIYEKI